MNKRHFLDPQGSPKTTTDQSITAALSRAIHEHKLPPGTKLGEDELAEIYNVSRTLVRTALRTLAHEQLVEIRRNRGAFVAKPSPKEAQEVFEARELLEPRTARSAAHNATPEDATRLFQHVELEQAALRSGDHGLALYLSGQLHVEIARIAAQDTITSFIETLIARSSLVVALYWRRESALCECHAHRSLAEAISQGKEILAGDLMQSHLVDLHSALNLSEVAPRKTSLRELLTPG
ncbi:MAG: GntR family transcriptional regulator [Pseudomonadota bacterium]